MKQKHLFSSALISRWSSWSFLQSDFAEEYGTLLQSGILEKEGGAPILWKTKQKYVLKVQLSSGKAIAYKRYSKIKRPLRYFLRYSNSALEALNYQRFAREGFPLPTLYGAGDTRKNGVLKSSFFISEFAEGYRDGKDFMPQFLVPEQMCYRDEFIRRNLILLAKCHDAGIFHRGFTPMNLLYKPLENADENGNKLRLIWIDIATCRHLPAWLLNRVSYIDPAMFLRLFALTPDETRTYLSVYCSARKNQKLSVDRLFQKVDSWIRKKRK